MPLYINGARSSSLPRSSTDSDIDAREHRALHPGPTRHAEPALNTQASTTSPHPSASGSALQTPTTTTPLGSPPASALQNLTTTTAATTTPPGSPPARALQLLSIKRPETPKTPKTSGATPAPSHSELTELAGNGQEASAEQAPPAADGPASERQVINN